jgi:sugar phosphate isomerase/epimerase
MPNIGLQLYTVRDVLKDDFAGTLRKVAKIGYAGIEGGGTGPMNKDDYLNFMREIGLIPISSGAGVDGLEKKGDEIMKAASELGVKYMMVSSGCKSAQEYMDLAVRLNACGKTANKYGIAFQYHNHAHEFQKFDGKSGFDILVDGTDPALVKFQVDAGWVNWAGENPSATLRRLKGRIVTIHVKDHTPGENKQFTEVGTGALPLVEVVRTAVEIGVQWMFVEQDTCARPTIESAEISFRNLQKALG